LDAALGLTTVAAGLTGVGSAVALVRAMPTGDFRPPPPVGLDISSLPPLEGAAIWGVIVVLVRGAFSCSARHSSVRLRQTPSAFRLGGLSLSPPPLPMELAPLDMGPGWPGAPIMAERARASIAAASRAWKTSGSSRSLDLARAACKTGWASRCEDA